MKRWQACLVAVVVVWLWLLGTIAASAIGAALAIRVFVNLYFGP